MIIGWIHPDNEIAEDEALYALATSYGLSEVSKNILLIEKNFATN